MADLNLKSKQHIAGDMFTNILAQLDLNDVNRASFIRTILESVAIEQFQHYVQMVTVLKSLSLDNKRGSDLDAVGIDLSLSRTQADKATGPISIYREEGFEKVATSFYSGLPAPLQGDTSINVNDASNALFSTSGTLILGRGTVNEEEVTYVVAPVNNTNYWTFTVSALIKNHGRAESVILKQGDDELIEAGTLI
jgi:uncharacterized phage protein gp47/JayE